MLNAAIVRGAMQACVLSAKIKEGQLVNMTMTALTIKSVKMPSVLLEGMLRGYPPTK
jgi:hypothetical protein